MKKDDQMDKIFCDAKAKVEHKIKMENIKFCSSCTYFSDKLVACTHKDNLSFDDNWLERKMIFKRHPSVINEKNDCRLFEKIAHP